MNREYGVTAGIDVHKKWLYVVVGDPDAPERCWARCRVGSTTEEVDGLRKWLQQRKVTTVVMESTAHYWRPVWMALERQFTLWLAQAHSNAAPKGRKTDYADARRLVKRLWAGDLRLSFVPEADQRGWRELTRMRVQYTREIARLRNRVEGLLEDSRIKVSGLLSDLFGTTGRRILQALVVGDKIKPHELAALADPRVRATREELERALDGKVEPVQRLLLGQILKQVDLLEQQIEEIEVCLAQELKAQQEVTERLCAIPGIGVEAAQAIIAEMGPAAASFPSAAQAASWIGVCPGRQESAGKSTSDTSPKGNRQMRRILCQCAWAAIRSKNTIWEQQFRRMVPRMGAKPAVWAVAHRLLRVIWIVLRKGVPYVEYGPVAENPHQLQRRLTRVLRQLSLRGINYSLILASESPEGGA